MSQMPPRPSGTVLALASLAHRLRALPAAAAWAMIAALLAATGLLDAAFGDLLSMFLLYLVAAGITAWRFGERAGLLVVAVMAALAAVADLARGAAILALPMTAARKALLCGEALHLLAALTLVLVVAGARRALEYERWRATTDPLTGALNRAAFAERLTRAMARGRGLLLLAYVDLDGFKALNDAHGHAAGDALLRLFADGAATAIAPADVVARTGGDEFALLAGVPPGEDGEAFARRLHHRLAELLDGAGHGVTCSVGALLIPARGRTDDAALIAASDALMYEAKRGGKNAVRVAVLPPPLMLPEPLPPPRLRLVVSDAA